MYWDPLSFTFSTVTGRRMASINQAIAPTWTGVHLASAAYRNSTYARFGSVTAPINTTAGDVTAERLILGNAALGTASDRIQITTTFVPPASPNVSVIGINSIATPSNSGSGTKGISIFHQVNPTASNGAGANYAAYYEIDHQSGAFNIGELTGHFSLVSQAVAASTVTDSRGIHIQLQTTAGTITTARGAHIQLIAGDGTITTGVGIDIERTQGGAGTFTTGIGLRINAVTGTIGTDIAIQSLGGQHRFVGPANFGTNATPSNTTNGDVTALRTHVGTDAAFVTAGVLSTVIVPGIEINAASLLLSGTITNGSVTTVALGIQTTFNGSGSAPIGHLVAPTFAPSASIGAAVGTSYASQSAPPVGVTITTVRSVQARSDYNNVAGAVTTGIAIGVTSPIVSGSLKPTTQYGIQILNQGVSGMTNAIGIEVAAQSGATNNYDMSFGTVDTTAAGTYYGRIPVLYNGLKKYVHVFNA